MSEFKSLETIHSTKRRKTTKQSPTSFVTWNCNGFTSRAKWDADALQKLLTETDYPDMICLQEARLKAYDATQRDRPAPSEYAGEVQAAMEGIFQDYQPIWSLADKKYAGTLTMIHKRLDDNDDDNDDNGEIENKRMVAFTLDGAIDVLLQRFDLTRQKVGLKDVVVVPPEKKKEEPAKKQMTMTSFFTQKKKPSASSSSNKTTASNKRHHHEEGRIQFFSFKSMDVLQTYVPNNGNKDESFAKRRQWDEHVLQFLKDRKKVLESCNKMQRPMLWCGDMNVAKDFMDGTHWVKSNNHNNNNNKKKSSNSDTNDGDDDANSGVYEWWTDEDKCFVGGKKAAQPQKSPEDTGMPSFTPAERRRFKELLKQGEFVDVWRARHPAGVTDSKLDPWDRPNYTWRGHCAKAGQHYAAKYQGKGQRLDYFLLSPSEQMLPLVEYCEILGYGERHEGLFCGSDHCALLLRLKASH